MAHSAFNVWLGLVPPALKVDQGFSEAMQLPKTGDMCLLTGGGYLAQTSHEDVGHDQDIYPRDFL